MPAGYYCGYAGRLQIQVSAAMQPVAGIREWKRNARSQVSEYVDFERPANAAGLPIAGICPGPVTITYDISGYFVSTPATGVTYTSVMFDAGTAVIADFLFDKAGSGIGIKGVTCVVADVTMGEVVDGVATFSASMRQTSDDPSPLVS